MNNYPVSPAWPLAPDSVRLDGGEAHVWRADLDRHQSLERRMWQLLSPDEHQRAERFKIESARRRFIAGRGLLRTILARYLDLEPDQLRFEYAAHGKPALAPDHGSSLHFNQAHTGGVALYAVASHRQVGVDVECIRPQPWDFQEVAQRFFAPGEVAAIQALPAHLQRQAFFACWTLKEAYVKAVGTGLTMPPNQFAVSFRPWESARLVSVEGAPQETARWSLQRLEVGPGYKAAICVEGHDWLLNCWKWSDDA